MKGFLDRIEDQQFAVILVEELNQEFILPKEKLPPDSTEKSYFDVTVENGQITAITWNEQETSAQQQKVDDMMEKLRSKSKGSKYKK
ncbi:DUF3006 domain-containing protein [Bacillus sp. MRMR6]|uniref:DUF3006 domain-containing protein n=1 Tax=Bacillus sp. MRMR6 TaxID=1928617 RepID=UPI00095237EC|nr:DUF3006 domain-containing protein [Bacillus sp. MRMR6]OLS40845.1 hypothetical protein BTR25_07075 [Bacillus sp. MRMR6]